MSKRIMFALFALTAIAGAQVWSASSGTFVDISTTGGTALSGIFDDSLSGITTTVGNGYWPAGPCTIDNNGNIRAGVATTATSGGVYGNVTIPATGLPSGLALAGVSAVLCPWWNDLYPATGNSTTQTYWQEAAGVLYIMWKNVNHFADATLGNGITFEVQVFDVSLISAPCDPRVQFLYNDSTFTGTYAGNSNGSGATIGYANTVAFGQANALWSYLTATVPSGTVLALRAQGFVFNITSPGGPGSGTVQVDIADCDQPLYFIPYTLAAGLYPNGWLYGLDIPLTTAISIFNSGYPFVGPVPQTLGATLYPGFQFWMSCILMDGTFTPKKVQTKTFTIP